MNVRNVARAPAPVFLDRDGTLIVEKHYLADPAQVQIEAGVAPALRQLQDAGHPLFVVSNQSGIGRGLLTQADALRVDARAAELLLAEGVRVVAWYRCPHAPAEPCACRKPLPGMALAAAAEWGLVLADSYVIGDKRSDVELADAIGGTGILLTTGHGHRDAAWARRHDKPVFDGLAQAAAYVLGREARAPLSRPDSIAGCTGSIEA